MRKILAALLLLFALATTPSYAQEHELPAKGEKTAPNPVLSYVIFSISTLVLLVIVCTPSRRPVPTEE